MLLLFGSRGRGDALPASDWDFGYIAAREVDAPGLLARIVEAVGSDHVDLVDLHAAGGMLRYRAARDGLAVFEAEPARADREKICEGRRFDPPPLNQLHTGGGDGCRSGVREDGDGL